MVVPEYFIARIIRIFVFVISTSVVGLVVFKARGDKVLLFTKDITTEGSILLLIISRKAFCFLRRVKN